MAFFDFTLTDLIAIGGLTLTLLGYIFQRSRNKTDAAKLAKDAAAEAARLTGAATVEAARLADVAKVEAVRLAEKAIATRDGMMDEVRTRIVAIETRQDIIWDFLIRRSKAELVTKKWGTIKSPLILTQEAIDCMEKLLPKMQPFYDALMTATPGADERQLFIVFEATFGDILVEHVCIPFNMTSGACVVAAIEMCKMRTHGEKHADTPATLADTKL